MADYYPLLSRAVGALSNSNAEARRSIYERARKALVGQLQAIQPPIAEADIARETDALDAAIARVEAEIAGKAAAEAAKAPEAPAKPVAPPPPPPAPKSEPPKAEVPKPESSKAGAAQARPAADPAAPRRAESPLAAGAGARRRETVRIRSAGPAQTLLLPAARGGRSREGRPQGRGGQGRRREGGVRKDR
ncbi:MAG: hypothetical protein V9G24_18330 [Rhodoblastus sp.]